MSTLDIHPDLRDDLRNAARDASISAARTFGFGGDTWSVQRPAGAGVGPKTMTPQPTVTALAYRQRPGGLAAALAGTPVLDDVWRMIIFSGDVEPGDVLTSVSEPTYIVSIDSIEPWYTYRRAELGRVR